MAAEAAKAYYTTSYSFGSGTTSTAALMVWRAISTKLEREQLPMTGEELAEVTGLSIEYIDNLFVQTYYQKHYGFRKFATIEEWRAWAEDEGVLYVPDKHDPVIEEEPAYDEDEEVADDEDAEQAD